jgi:hypothetical protein
VRRYLVTSIFGLLLSDPRPACADALRCGVYLVRTGDPTAEVEQKCGPPTSRQSIRGRRGRRETEIWTYDLGPTEFVRTLVFGGGVLAAIIVGGYGH